MRSANLRNMAERTKFSELKEKWISEAKDNEKEAMEKLKGESKSKGEGYKTPLQLLKEEIKGEKEANDYRKLKYSRSIPGRASQFISKNLIKRRVTPQELKAFIIKRQLQRMQQSQGIQPNIYKFDGRPCQVGWESSIVAPQVEREVSSYNGFAMDGQNTALSLEREISSISNFQHINPSNNVNQECDFFSKILDYGPSKRVSQETEIYSNMLN